MDFEIVFWILFLLVPVLSRMMKKRREAKRPPQEAQAQPEVEIERRYQDNIPGPEPQLTPFEEALRQIQDALVEAKSETSQEPPRSAPTLAHLPAPAPAPEQTKAPARRRMTLFEQADAQSQKSAKMARPARRKKPVKKPFKGSFKSSFKGSFKDSAAGSFHDSFEDSDKDTFYDTAFDSDDPYESSFHESVHTHVPKADEAPGRKKKTLSPEASKWRRAYVMHEIISPPRSREAWRSRLSR